MLLQHPTDELITTGGHAYWEFGSQMCIAVSAS